MREIDTEAERMFAEVGEQEAVQVPQVGWSVAQCFRHLNLTTEGFLQAWKAAETIPATGAPRGYGWLERAMLGWMEPPYRMKSKTPAGFVPGASGSWDLVKEEFRGEQERVLAAVAEAGGFAMDTNKVQSLFASWLRYGLGFSFDVFAAHERRHLWQARRVAEAMRARVPRAG